jgi:hypothetical protein
VYVILVEKPLGTYAAEEEKGGKYYINYKNRLRGKWMDKNGSGSCPMTGFYTKVLNLWVLVPES